MKRIIFATSNSGKLREIRNILNGYEIVSMKEAGFDGEIDEDGTSFEENALIKARAVWEATGALVLADDSGLEIDALGGEPGIYSARYLSPEASFDEKMDDVLRRMEGVRDEDRTARFVCAIAAVYPDGRSETVRGTMEGVIAHEKKGDRGFGYDPIFYLPGYGRTVAEIDEELKNAESHRARALELIRKKLDEDFDNE